MLQKLTAVGTVNEIPQTLSACSAPGLLSERSQRFCGIEIERADPHVSWRAYCELLKARGVHVRSKDKIARSREIGTLRYCRIATNGANRERQVSWSVTADPVRRYGVVSRFSTYQLAESDAEQTALCVLVKTKEPKIEWHTAVRSGDELAILAKIPSVIPGTSFKRDLGIGES